MSNISALTVYYMELVLTANIILVLTATGNVPSLLMQGSLRQVCVNMVERACVCPWVEFCNGTDRNTQITALKKESWKQRVSFQQI